VLIGHGVREHLRSNQPITMEMLVEPKLLIPMFLLALLILIPNLVRSIRKNLRNNSSLSEGE